jgi:hypothetical protein
MAKRQQMPSDGKMFWQISFRLKEIDQVETRIAYGDHVC